MSIVLIGGAISLRGTRRADPDDLAGRARVLVQAGSAQQAVILIESELAGSAKATDSAAYLVLGHARFEVGRPLDALSAYERALLLSPEIANDEQVKANVAHPRLRCSRSSCWGLEWRRVAGT